MTGELLVHLLCRFKSGGGVYVTILYSISFDTLILGDALYY